VIYVPEISSPATAHVLSVSVIVPTHEDNASLRRCLESIARAAPPPNEVILVADGAGDSIRPLSAEFGYRYLRYLTPSGPARSRNMGAFHARSDLLFFVDSDVLIPKNIIELIRSIFHQDPGLTAVIGSYDDTPAADNFLSQYKNLFHHYTHQNGKEKASTFWGACGAIRRDVFMEVGGFDERYPRPCVEDIELGYRITRAGHRIRLCKSLQCKHLKQYGVLSLLKSDLLDRALPWTQLILRDRILVNDLNLRSASRFSVALLFAMIGLLVAGFWRWQSIALASAIFALVLAINSPVYRFFHAKRGSWFMIRTIPWHCIYYLCCGLAFGIGLIRVLLKATSAILGRMIPGRKSPRLRKSA
jgi:GT2 family glycosyltransferase